MILWTAQTADIFPITRDYFALDAYDEFEFIEFYLKMKGKMHPASLSLMKQNNTPIWCWKRYSYNRISPGVGASLLPQRTHGVCIKLSVPDNLVLLSQFEMWNWILNGWNIPPFDNQQDSFNAIFDLNFGDDEFWGDKKRRVIQAVIPCIKPEWIISYRLFTGNITKHDLETRMPVLSKNSSDGEVGNDGEMSDGND